MARKVLDWNGGKGRDAGKTFRITEMSAMAGHDWATRLLLGMLSSGMELDDGIAAQGLAGVASQAMSLIGKVPVGVVKPLLDELMACVVSVQDKGTRALIEDDIEEVATIFTLQMAVFKMHVEPFTQGG